MKFTVNTPGATRQRTACAIVGIYADGTLSDTAKALDKASGGLISDVTRNRDIRGEAGETLLLTHTGKLPCKRILLVGLGKPGKLEQRGYRQAMRAACTALGKAGHIDAINYLGLETVGDTDAYRKARIAVETWHEASYRFTTMKSAPTPQPGRLKSMGLACTTADRKKSLEGVKHATAIAGGVALARDLGNLPPNICTPDYLVKRAQAIARKSKKMRLNALRAADLRKLGMGALLAVTQGSELPPRFIVLQYRGGTPKSQPVVLVGKGITFDSGGISIKPGPAMDEMKYDMCGAASVLGVLQAAAELNLRVNLVGIVPACENMPSGTATRPGDIVRSLSGQTVEILNTDAEGRLILCDALTYAQRFKPSVIIDIATLTGACLIALGRVRSGLLSNSDELATALLEAGQNAGDRAWRLPLDEEYGELLKSPFADVANIGGRDAGTITAAAFLSRFVGKTSWAHLDIAGTAWVQGNNKGGTGRPVPLLMEYLLQGA
ncbi:MAG: leucyl aminopeptidase [Gammaproteobacteria bacterium]|nr:leucyl aminopeptidase [Gammaproteobacteria bacterium]